MDWVDVPIFQNIGFKGIGCEVFFFPRLERESLSHVILEDGPYQVHQEKMIVKDEMVSFSPYFLQHKSMDKLP